MSQSFIKKPDNGPHSALAGLGVLASERGAEHTPGPHMDAKALIEGAARLLGEWERKYGEHQCDWLPPAGQVRWHEDAAAYVARHSLAAPMLAQKRLPVSGGIRTLQEALDKFAQMVASKWLFEEASVALDRSHDFKVTITCTETPKGYVVAMHRHETERLGSHSFIKLTHGEWESSSQGEPGRVPRPGRWPDPPPAAGVDAPRGGSHGR